MLGAVGYIDVCIPRGGRRLIDFVRDNARIPVIETGAGVVHVYFDKDGDLEMGKAIVNNSKTRRVSVCNALDTLLVHKDRLGDLPELLAPMKDRVTFYMNEEERYDTEFMDYKMNVVTVESLDDAIDHIARHGSGHSEAIITQNEAAARRFQRSTTLPTRSRCSMRLLECAYLIHRRSTVRSWCRNWYLDTEIRTPRTYGVRGNDNLQVAHRGRRTG